TQDGSRTGKQRQGARFLSLFCCIGMSFRFAECPPMRKPGQEFLAGRMLHESECDPEAATRPRSKRTWHLPLALRCPG
ncbi:hypothetical protein RQ832_21085, partial [Roseomonas sp. DSM 102946]|nr:hypothetical protein [Roseomonas sp. DSM 102946]